MASESDNLRRSKRNKYQHLDVSLTTSATEKRKSLEEEAAAMPGTSDEVAKVEESVMETPTEENKRSRRPTTKNASFVYADESEDEDEKVTTGMVGSFKCEKCPSRFESRPGLANHIRLHGRSDKRKFGCDQCDFSCGSAKAIRNHKRIHNRPFKEQTPPANHSDTRSDKSDSPTPPQLTPVKAAAQSNQQEVTPENMQQGGPPKLAAVSPILQGKSDEPLPARKRNSCSECPFAARSRHRYERHILMHSRKNGYQCHACTLTTQSSGFLKRHIVEVHKLKEFPWPPKFVGGEEKVKVEEVAEEKVKASKPMKATVLLTEAKKDGEMLRCSVEKCPFKAYTTGQIVVHKRRVHLEKTKKVQFRCCSCGLKLKSPGALRIHRLRRHPLRNLSKSAKRVLIREQDPFWGLKKIIKKDCVVNPPATNGAVAQPSASDPPSPAPPAPLATSKSSPALVNLPEPEGDYLSSALLGPNLEPWLVGVKFCIDELEKELEAKYEIQCEDCPYATNNPSKMDRHIAKHTVPAEYHCPKCSFMCRSEDLMRMHVRIHMAMIYKCRREAEKLVGNLPQIIAPEPPTAPAPVVAAPVVAAPVNTTPAAKVTPSKVVNGTSKSASAKKKKPTNIIIVIDGVRMRKCIDCPYMTKHACDLATHYNMHVNAPQKFKCVQCTYSTKRAVSLRTHYVIHKQTNALFKDIKPLPIKIAGVQMGLRTGKGINKIYSCKQCPYVSRSIVMLNLHFRHHLQAKGANFKCSKCPFYSKYCAAVEDHILMHPESDARTERLVPLPRGKRNHDNKKNGSTPLSRPKRSTPKQSARSSPAPPMLLKEEPMDFEVAATSSDNSNSKQMKMETDEDSKDNCDTKPPVAAAAAPVVDLGKPQLGHSYDRPLSILVQDFLQPEEPLLRLIRREADAEQMGQCPECPFADPDELIMRLHRECHTGPARLMKCDLCSFSCMAPEALHKHIALHLPALSPNSERLERKKAAQRRRAQATEVIPQGVPHFPCNRCSFKCMTKDAFQDHMMFHAQELQRRLLTTIKRANIQAEELAKSAKVAKSARRAPKKSDKFHSCPHCSFRCETYCAYVRHSEMHTLNGLYKCKMCSYSANTYSVTSYHETNHHSDHTLAGLSKSAVLAPEAITMKVERTEAKILELADNVYRCNKCEDFKCFELLQLRRHFEQSHYETADEKAAVESLAMGLLPLNSSIITTA